MYAQKKARWSPRPFARAMPPAPLPNYPIPSSPNKCTTV